MFFGEYEIRDDLKYTKTHEWIMTGDGIVTIGVTDYASKEMGDVAYVDLPSEGAKVSEGGMLCEIESVKAVSEVESPVDGTIEEVNSELEDLPEKVNEDPYGAWIAKIRYSSPPKNVMDAAGYKSLLEGIGKD